MSVQPTIRRRRQRQVASRGLLLLVTFQLSFACSKPPPPPAPAVVRPVKLLEVVGGIATGSAARSFPGRIAAIDSVDLSFRVGGPLVELPINEGDSARQGQVIARIDPRDFRIALDAARADRERTEADFRRYASLYEKDAASQAQLDQARAAMEVAKARLEDAEARLADTTLRSPFNALVARRLVDNFQEVQAGQPIATLVGLDQVKVEVDLPEGIVVRASQQGEIQGRVVARIEALPGREFELALREVALQADPRTQTYRATFVMPQIEEITILPGMTVQVAFFPDAGEESQRLTIPAAAVVANASGGSDVWVVDPRSMTVTRRAVRTGSLVGSENIEIVDGLVPGETIAVTAVSRLEEGMQVRRLEG